MRYCPCPSCSALPDHPHVPGKHINPETGIPPIHEWGDECGRGWVSDSRFFATASVLKRANRNKTRDVYRAKEKLAFGGAS